MAYTSNTLPNTADKWTLTSATFNLDKTITLNEQGRATCQAEFITPTFPKLQLLVVCDEPVDRYVPTTYAKVILNGYKKEGTENIIDKVSHILPFTTGTTLDGKTIYILEAAQPLDTVVSVSVTFWTLETITLYKYELCLDASIQEDIQSAVETAAESKQLAEGALATADGKNTAYYNTSAPAGTDYTVNDIWFNTAENYRMYYWSGSAWIGTKFGDAAIGNLNASHITAGTIDAAVVTVINLSADNITTGKIQSIDGTSYLDLVNNKFVLGTNKLVFDGTGLSIDGKLAVTTDSYKDDIISITSTDTIFPTKMKMSASTVSTGIDKTNYAGDKTIKNITRMNYSGFDIEKSVYNKSDGSFADGYGIMLTNDLLWQEDGSNTQLTLYQWMPSSDGYEKSPRITMNAKGYAWFESDVNIGEPFIAPNGYTKLTNGLIMQWGTAMHYSAPSGDVYTEVLFPITFPHAVLNANFSVYGTSGAAYLVPRGINSLTASGIAMIASNNASGQTVAFYWQALGY